MMISNIKKIEYWTREAKMPLFWLTDKNGRVVLGDNVLCLYHKSSAFYYYSNERYEKDVREGFKFYNKPDNIKKYLKKVNLLIKELEKQTARLNQVKWRELNEQQVKTKFYNLQKIVLAFIKLYKKTEDVKSKGVENKLSKKQTRQFNSIAKQRLKLRTKSEPLFYFMLDKALKQKIAKLKNLTVQDLYFYSDTGDGGLIRG